MEVVDILAEKNEENCQLKTLNSKNETLLDKTEGLLSTNCPVASV